jgi:hypothetical protein
MRMLFPVAIVVTLVCAATPGQAANCPRDARAASYSVWGPNRIPTGTTVTGQHACGRQMSCIGGFPGQGETRRCRWL